MTARRFIYPLAELDDTERLDFRGLTPADLGAGIEALRRLERYDARVTLKRTATGAVAEFQGEFTVILECVRCLEDAAMTFKERLSLEYVTDAERPDGHAKVSLQAKDIDRVHITGNDIDLTIGLRELVVLALPIAPLCKPSCAGICPICGRNLNRGACSCRPPAAGRFTPAAPVRRSRRKK